MVLTASYSLIAILFKSLITKSNDLRGCVSFSLIPIAPLSRTKSRLRDCFPKGLLKELTIAMFKDLAKKVQNVDFFDHKIVYCHNDEILELAEEFGLIGIKEKLTLPRKSFDLVINDLNNIAIKDYDAVNTIFTFLDVILLSQKNLIEISNLMKLNQLVVCPAIHSAGISIFGRSPPDIIPTHFSTRSMRCPIPSSSGQRRRSRRPLL